MKLFKYLLLIIITLFLVGCSKNKPNNENQIKEAIPVVVTAVKKSSIRQLHEFKKFMLMPVPE
jgi:PBP1b-binding outer membrane lipoprotein LpoB